MARVPRRFRDAVAVLGIALVASALILAPPLDRFRGLSIDVLTMLRWRMFGGMHKPEQSPTVVVALDEETYRTPPFAGTPAITWSTEIGQVLTAILAGGAKVVGFDIVFPTSIEQYEIPFGDQTLGARVRGFDGDFLRALYSWLGSDYRPSIAVDMEAARPTEGEHTIGDLVRRSDRRGIDTPILRAALCNLQIYEARRSAQT